MVAAILSIGTELTRGELIDRNAPMLAAHLDAMGYEVRRLCAVDDDLERIARSVDQLARESTLLVTTGGTGAGDDDRTREAVARALGVGMVVDEETLTLLRRRRVVDAGEVALTRHAELPEGAEVLARDGGRAPLFRVVHRGCAVYVLPGAPAEVERAAHSVLSRALVRSASPRGASRTLRCYGIDEDALTSRLHATASRFADVSFALRPTMPELELRVVVRDGAPTQARARVDAAVEALRAVLGDLVFGEGDETFAAAVGRGLRSRGHTLAIAESCTGGLIGAMLTAVPGSSDFLLLDAVTYANTAKERVLGVAPEVLRGHGAVSAECTRAMAEGARRVSGADLALAVSGIAGPTGGTAERPVGTVHFALADGDDTEMTARRFDGDRAAVQRQAAYAALAMVRARCGGRLPARLPSDCG